MHAATVSFAEFQVWLIFEGCYQLGCGFYSNKCGSCCRSLTYGEYMHIHLYMQSVSILFGMGVDCGKSWGQLAASIQCLNLLTCECCIVCGFVLGSSVAAAPPSSLWVEEADSTL